MNHTIGASIGCKKPLYHANIDPDAVKRLTEAQKRRAVDCLEKALGFDNQPRIVIEHQKKGREHLHVVWLRVDTDRMRVLSDSFNYYKHERVATALEHEFGLPLTKRALTREEGLERPRPAPSKADLQQAQRTGLTIEEARRQLTAIWNSGGDLSAALEAQGFTLLKGDRAAFVVLDPYDGQHNLARRIEGVKTADIRERLGEEGIAQLPTMKEARQLHKARQQALGEAGRLHWDTVTEERIAEAGIAYARAAQHIEGKRQRRAGRIFLR